MSVQKDRQAVKWVIFKVLKTEERKSLDASLRVMDDAAQPPDVLSRVE
jgi:hypothetical protein